MRYAALLVVCLLAANPVRAETITIDFNGFILWCVDGCIHPGEGLIRGSYTFDTDAPGTELDWGVAYPTTYEVDLPWARTNGVGTIQVATPNGVRPHWMYYADLGGVWITSFSEDTPIMSDTRLPRDPPPLVGSSQLINTAEGLYEWAADPLLRRDTTATLATSARLVPSSPTSVPEPATWILAIGMLFTLGIPCARLKVVHQSTTEGAYRVTPRVVQNHTSN